MDIANLALGGKQAEARLVVLEKLRRLVGNDDMRDRKVNVAPENAL